jgi:hypothetical protein
MQKAVQYDDAEARFRAECLGFCRKSHEARWPSRPAGVRTPPPEAKYWSNEQRARWENAVNKAGKNEVAEWQRRLREQHRDYLTHR